MKINEVSHILDKPLLSGDAERISAVVSDSRSVLPGAVFVCISGAQFDGHEFIEEAIQRCDSHHCRACCPSTRANWITSSRFCERCVDYACSSLFTGLLEIDFI